MEILKSPKKQNNEIDYLEDVQLISGPKAPLIIEQQDYLSIKTSQILKTRKKIEKYNVDERDNIKISSIPRETLKSEYIDELVIQGYNRPENEIQLIDQMEILPIERRNLLVQNIDNLVILRDYDNLNINVKPIWDSLDVQVSGGLNLVSHKDLGLECQEIDNFEIIGSINIPILEQEYINSIEIVERNSSINRQRNSLLIECMDDLQISPSRNEVRFLNANVPRLSYDMENVDDFEIIGRNKEEEFEVEKIDKISYQDKVIENQYDEINTRQYNTKKIKQINRGDEENEIIRYREDYKKKSNYPYSSLEEDRYKIIKQTRIYEQENMYDRED